MGEREGDRDVIDRNTRDLMESGIPRERARKEAQDSMRRVDRRLRDERKR